MKTNLKETSRRTLYEDNLFREAVREAARIEGELLLRENSGMSEDDADISLDKQKAFRERLERSLQDKRNKERRLSHIKVLQRAAVILLVLSSVLAVSLFSVDAFRVRFFNLLIETKPEYTEFRLEEKNGGSDGDQGNGAQSVDWPNSYIPTYVPEGYSVESSENYDSMKLILFQNAEGKIIDYAQYSESVSFNYDTEDAVLQDITVNGEAGMLVVKGENYSIIWKHESSIFVVRTQIDEQETLKIAENIKFIK